MSASAYTRWRLTLPAELEELLSAELWARGCLGLEVLDGGPGRLRFEVYFSGPAPTALDALDGWRRRGIELEGSEPVAERDWLAGYRARARPIEVGRRFRIETRLADPRAPATPHALTAPAADGRITLKIPAQTAFGTGSHESTRLVIQWLEELEIAGLDVLDVGTGSGILSFAAELLGARRVVGFDRDAQAVCIARRNARLNGLGPRFFAGRLGALRPAPRFDLALVNIMPEHILDELPQAIPVLRPGGRVIHSGNLRAWRDELVARFAAAGFATADARRQDDWVAFLLSPTAGERSRRRS